MTPAFSYVALLGGSFNPPHSGHFRMALEVQEAFAPESVNLIPCASPPHKSGKNLLPFDLRVAMLESVTERLPGFCVNPVERERPGPSYTVDTLRVLKQNLPEKRLLFILGGEDFTQLTTWHRWQEIPQSADLVILPRNDEAANTFERTTQKLWPDAADIACPFPAVQKAYALPGGSALYYLPQPCLEISSSLVRSRWLAGRDINFLVPDPILALLEKNTALVRSLWQEDDKSHPFPAGHAKLSPAAP